MSLQGTIARHIDPEEVAILLDKAYQRLSLVGITGPLADRIALRFVLGACNWTEAETTAAVERLFPRREAVNVGQTQE